MTDKCNKISGRKLIKIKINRKKLDQQLVTCNNKDKSKRRN